MIHSTPVSPFFFYLVPLGMIGFLLGHTRVGRESVPVCRGSAKIPYSELDKSAEASTWKLQGRGCRWYIPDRVGSIGIQGLLRWERASVLYEDSGIHGAKRPCLWILRGHGATKQMGLTLYIFETKRPQRHFFSEIFLLRPSGKGLLPTLRHPLTPWSSRNPFIFWQSEISLYLESCKELTYDCFLNNVLKETQQLDRGRPIRTNKTFIWWNRASRNNREQPEQPNNKSS